MIVFACRGQFICTAYGQFGIAVYRECRVVAVCDAVNSGYANRWAECATGHVAGATNPAMTGATHAIARCGIVLCNSY